MFFRETFNDLYNNITDITAEIDEIKDSTSQKRIRLIKRLDVLSACKAYQ